MFCLFVSDLNVNISIHGSEKGRTLTTKPHTVSAKKSSEKLFAIVNNNTNTANK